ncbi:unnamed protein product [Closterium sp. NIES-54]
MTTLRVLLHVAAQRDYELHSLDFSTAFLQGSLHEEIWLRRPPGFTVSFPARTQWSLRWPVYGLRQAPREWNDTLMTTLAALGFAPSTADPSLFLRTDTSLPPFYVLVYVDNLVFATVDTEALTLVKLELQKRHTCTDLGELRSYLGLQITRDRARRTITLTQSHMVHQVLQRFSFQFSSPQPTPLSTSHSLSAPPSDESVQPSGPYSELALKGALGCCEEGTALLVQYRSSQGYTFSLSSGSVSWRSTRSSSVLSSSCEAEIFAGAMAAQELCSLTYLLTDLGEAPRSPPVLYVDNKAMIALCQEHRLEHRTKHIALRYFLARELQQRGQRRLAYVASRANTVDIFTKALPPGDHRRFSTVLGRLGSMRCHELSIRHDDAMKRQQTLMAEIEKQKRIDDFANADKEGAWLTRLMWSVEFICNHDAPIAMFPKLYARGRATPPETAETAPVSSAPGSAATTPAAPPAPVPPAAPAPATAPAPTAPVPPGPAAPAAPAPVAPPAAPAPEAPPAAPTPVGPPRAPVPPAPAPPGPADPAAPAPAAPPATPALEAPPTASPVAPAARRQR